MGNIFEHHPITGRSYCRSHDTASSCVSQINWSWITSGMMFYAYVLCYIDFNDHVETNCKLLPNIELCLSFTYPSILSFHRALNRLFSKHHRDNPEASISMDHLLASWISHRTAYLDRSSCKPTRWPKTWSCMRHHQPYI